MTCSACQAQFTVVGHAVPAVPPRPPAPPRPTGIYQWTGTLCGLLTPPALALVALLCLLPISVIGSAGLPGAVVAGVGIAYLTKRFTKWHVATRGDAAFYYYKRSAGVAFLVVPAVAAAIFMLQAEKVEGDEGAGLIFLILTIGLYFLSILLAAAWLAGIKWAGWRE